MLMAAERSDASEEENANWEVREEDVEGAIHDLVVMGGDLTSSSLGFPSEPKD